MERVCQAKIFMMSSKILMVYNTLIPYKREYFNLLNKKLDVKFLFTREHKKAVKTYDNVDPDLKYEVLSYLRIGRYAFAFSLIPKLLGKDYSLVLAHDPHVLETHLTFFMAKLRRKKFIVSSDTWNWPRRPLSKLLNPMIKFMVRHADACIAIGTRSRQQYIQWGAKPEKIHIMPHASKNYEVKDYKKNMKELNNKINIKNKKVILCLGRLIPYKGTDYLIKAFSKLKDNNVLLIGGTGPLKKDLELLVKNLGLRNVYFLGWIEEEKKGFYLSTADIFVLPATFKDYDAEAWGLILNEVMFHGKPLVVTDAVGAADDLVRDGINGFVVKHRNVEELADALRKLLDNKELREKMGKMSKKIVNEEYTYEKMNDSVVEAVKKCLDYKFS